MEWIDTAVAIEKEGEQFYRNLAEKAESKGMHNIFTMLADDEVTHRKRFEAMKRQDFDEKTAASIAKHTSKKIFSETQKDQLAAEEKFHYQMIDSICIMVERPERWVEFAEFGVREDH